ncbi:MAG TPA: hypothetical protein VFK47_06370 [Ktedonobacteraceae bacterium]|nr:hypothetical protein [Ktedonobacteraceae bacterium]
MPKARNRSKGSGRKSTTGAAAPVSQPKSARATSSTTVPTARNRPFVSPGIRGPQSLVMPAMVALGSWGLAFSFIVFSSDPNHILFGGMAILLGLLWTFSFVMRLRKLLSLRQKS